VCPVLIDTSLFSYENDSDVENGMSTTNEARKWTGHRTVPQLYRSTDVPREWKKRRKVLAGRNDRLVEEKSTPRTNEMEIAAGFEPAKLVLQTSASGLFA